MLCKMVFIEFICCQDDVCVPIELNHDIPYGTEPLFFE